MVKGTHRNLFTLYGFLPEISAARKDMCFLLLSIFSLVNSVNHTVVAESSGSLTYRCPSYRYLGEYSLGHEFAHTMHQIRINYVDLTSIMS